MDLLSLVGATSKGVAGEYDENLVYDSTNINAKFPNVNNTNIDSTGNILTATGSDGEALSIVHEQAPIVVQDGLTNYYSLNADSTDGIGTDDGTDTSMTYDGTSSYFSGVGSQILTLLNIGNTSSMSWSIWVKDLIYHDTVSNFILSTYNQDYLYLILLADGSIESNLHDGVTSYGNVSTGVSFDTTTCRNINLVHDLSSGLYLYVDGVLVSSIVQSVTQRRSLSFGAGVEIGKNPGSTQDTFRINGSISNFRAYNKALTTQEVKAIYDAELAEHTI